MIRNWLLGLLVPCALAVTLGACENQNAVQPGYVNAASSGYRGEAGRVVSIRDVDLANTRSGVSQGTLIGGGVGGVGGAIAGAAIGGNAGSAILGGVLGAVGGAIAGTAIDRNSPSRGIAVTVQKDDGSAVTIAQKDNGDVQMGDRVIIVYDRNGVAHAIRDTASQRD